jgi:hypothetical protein
MMNKILYTLTLLCICSVTFAQDKAESKPAEKKISLVEKYTDEYLDTVVIKKKLKLNDYSLVGVQYGATLSQMMWNPSQNQKMLLLPVNFGVTYTLYGKMFGYMPYFGFQTGLFYGKEGYQFEYNEDKDYTYKIEGAEKAVFEVLELPVLSHLHIDFWHMKIIAQIGCYVGYRMGIERFPGITGNVTEEVRKSFMPYDIRFDYGIKGGVGFGLVFDPIEIHFQAMYKHSLSSLYKPDYYSEYYYRFAYPTNIIISAGIHFQLTKRSGMSKQQLKQQAKNIVYEIGDVDSKGR